MKKSFKISLWVIGVLVLILLVALFGFSWLVNANDFKPQIAAMVKQRTGRDLNMLGDLQISLIPVPSIKTGQLILNNAPGFTDKVFAVVNESELQVKWLPLLSNQVSISRIFLRGLSLNLTKNNQGVSNWQDLHAVAATDVINSINQPPATSSSPIDDWLKIGEFYLEQGNIHWENLQEMQDVTISDVKLNAKQVGLGVPINIALDLKVDGGRLQHQIKLTSQLLVNKQFEVFKVIGLELNSVATGDNIPGGSLAFVGLMDTLEYDRVQHSFHLEGMRLTSQNFSASAAASGSTANDKLTWQGVLKIPPFNPKLFMQKQKITFPVLKDPAAMDIFAADFDWHGTKDAVAVDSMNVKLDQSALTGKAQWLNFQHPVITLSAELDTLDVDRYFPLQASTTSNVPIPMLSSALVIASTDQLIQPLERLKNVDLNGKVLIHQLKMHHLEMQDVSLDLQSKSGELHTQQSVGQLYQGSYQGSASLTIMDNLPHLQVDETFRHLDLESFFLALNVEPKITGFMNSAVKMQGQGISHQALIASLVGDLQVDVMQGAFRHFNLQKILENAKSLVNGQVLDTQSSSEKTFFSELKGSAILNQGVIQNHDLVATAAPLKIRGEGTIDLNTAQIAYQLKASLLEGTAPIDEINQLPLILVLEGALASPKIRVAGLAAYLEKHLPEIEKKKDQLLEKLDSTLKKKLGVGTAELLKKLF